MSDSFWGGLIGAGIGLIVMDRIIDIIPSRKKKRKRKKDNLNNLWS